MRGYFGLGQLSASEKQDILNQHKSVYNGYQTMQPQVSNTQPLYVYDAAGDKEGFVVNNKGEVKKYTNMGINESKKEEVDEFFTYDVSDEGIEKEKEKRQKRKDERKNDLDAILSSLSHDEDDKVETKEVCDECGSMIMDGMCTECNYGHMEEGMGETCECGGTMYEGVCNECGSGYMEEETGHLDDIYNQEDLNPTAGFDYIQGSSNDVDTFEGMHKKLYKEDESDEFVNYNDNMEDEDEDDMEDEDEEDMEDNDDFQDYESSDTEDGMDDPDNEDDGYEDLNASEVTDGELEEIDIEDLIKGKKYKYNHPLHSNEFEYDNEHKYPEGENMYSFSSGKTGYAIPRKQVKDYVSHLDDEEFGSIEEQGGNVDDMNDDDVQPAYNFDSNGPGDVYPVNEFEDDVKEYEPMESAWSEDELEEGDIYGDPEFTETDVSGVQGIYGAMDRAYDFDSGGPGKAGPYQEFSYESKMDEDEDFKEVDEDLKESFLIQKNKITEMFNRFNKYN
jgi:hypothetical protein